MTEKQKELLYASGIDVAEVVERTMGNENLLIRVLRCYADTTIPEKLTEAAVQEDYEAAFQHAHALKGIAGNLSLKTVTAVNNQLMNHLRNKEYEDVKEETQAVLAVHREAVKGIINFLEQ